MKWIKHIINVTLWTVVGFYFLTAALINVPYIQRMLADTVAQLVAKTLNTKVEVGRIDLGMFNRIIIDNTTIYDQVGKPMVRAARLAVRIDPLELIEGRIRISSAQMFATHFNLYRLNANTPHNFQFAIDALASKDSTNEKKPLDIAVNSYIMRHCSVSYDQWDKPAHRGRFDTNHIRMSEIGTYIILRTLTNDSLDVSVKKLTAKEQSGLKVDNIKFNLTAGKAGGHLTDFSLQMPHSRISIDKFKVKYRLDAQGGIDRNSIRYEGRITPSDITLADISALVPGLGDFHSKVTLNIAVNGTGKHINVSNLNLTSNSGDLNIIANGWYESTSPHTSWNINLDRFNASAKTIEFLSQNIKGKDINIPEAVYRLGDISLQGHGNGNANGDISAHTTLSTGIGKANLSIEGNANRQFSGHLLTDDIALGTLLGDERLGDITTDISFSGSNPKGGSPTVSAKGVISKFAFNGYTYSNIDIDGTYAKDDITGSVSIDDPNISLTAEGHLGTGEKGKGKTIQIEAMLGNFRPAVTRLSEKWGDATFTASLSADIFASGISDSEGIVTLRDFGMTSSTDTCNIHQMQVRTGYDHQGHYLVMESDFGYAMLTGYFNYSSLATSITTQLGRHIPILAPSGTRQKGDNNFTFIAYLNSTDWMKPLLGIPLSIQQPIQLRGSMEDSRNSLVLECMAPQFTYNEKPFTDANLFINSSADSLVCSTEVVKHQDNGDRLDLSVVCNANDNLVDASLKWCNENKTRGELNATSSFGKNERGVTYAHVVVKPSNITIGDKTWKVHSSDILYMPKHIDINEFTIAHDRQHIIVNGTASASKSDSLNIDLNGIDVGYILDLVNFHSVDFDGNASGKALVVAPFGEFNANANLTVDDFLFEHGRMGVLDAKVNWNTQESQIDIDAIANDGDDARTVIKGYVSPKKNYIDLAIRADSTHIDFMHSFTKSFISQIDGRAVGEVRLAGPLSTINLTGKLVVNGSAMIRPLNCRYTLDNDTITLIPDEIELRNAVIRDAYGNAGHVNGFIHHKHLTRLSYDLNVKADNLLAYDFRDFGNDTFYGTVYADGNVDIQGRSGYLKMDVDVTPKKNSTFVYNASTNDQISSQEFINWNDVTSIINNQSSIINNQSSII
ncbi:MAG: hypothetical protein ACI3YT_00450, partial [Prevotella sp.]